MLFVGQESAKDGQQRGYHNSPLYLEYPSSLSFWEMPFSFEISHVVNQQLDHIFLNGLSSA